MRVALRRGMPFPLRCSRAIKLIKELTAQAGSPAALGSVRLMKARYVGSLLLISTTTTDPERTYPWGKTHPKRARFSHPKSGRSWPFAKRVDCSIATNDEQPEYRVPAHDV